MGPLCCPALAFFWKFSWRHGSRGNLTGDGVDEAGLVMAVVAAAKAMPVVKVKAGTKTGTGIGTTGTGGFICEI